MLASTFLFLCPIMLSGCNGDPSGLDEMHETTEPHRVPGHFEPAWSPNGSEIAVSSNHPEGGESFDIDVIDILGNAVQLTNGLSARSPSWSPDGSRIAFSGGVGVPSLYVINRDGSGLTELLASPDSVLGKIAWSPDGETIAFEKGSGAVLNVGHGIYLFDIATSVVTRLTEPGSSYFHLAWSPDGSQVVFYGITLYRMEIDGSGVVELTNNFVGVEHPAWSPCTEIAFLGVVPRPGGTPSPFAGIIHVMDSDGSNIRELTSGRKPTWSPDCSKIAFESRQGISIINADGSGQRQLTGVGTPGF